MISTVDLVLTGGRAGKTCVLNNKQFVRGVLRLRGSHDQLQPVIRFYGNAYHAFPAGSQELAVAQKRDREEEAKQRGDNHPETASRPGAADGVERSGVHDDSGQHQATGSAVHDQGGNGSQAGSAGVRASGDRHDDSGLRTGQKPEQQQSDANGDLGRIREAVLKLDPAVNEHWTQDGKPTVEAVVEALNDQAINRRLIDAAAADLTRQVVAEKRKG